MKLLRTTPTYVKPTQPKLPTMGDVLTDEAHGIGKKMKVLVTINDGKITQTVIVTAGHPGLACNRAYKVAKEMHKGRMRVVAATFDVEVME